MNDERLIQALVLYEEQWLASLPSEEAAAQMYTLSPRFERRMARLFAQQKKPYYHYVNRTWKRAVLAVVITLMLFAASMSVSAIRKPIIDFVIRVYERFTSLFYHTTYESADRLIYRPTYLPNGFTLTQEEILSWETILQYENARGDAITCRQYPWHRFELQADTESTDFDEVEINGHIGVFFSNKGWNSLVWSEGENSFCLMSNIDKSTLIKIASSVEIVD